MVGWLVSLKSGYNLCVLQTNSHTWIIMLCLLFVFFLLSRPCRCYIGVGSRSPKSESVRRLTCRTCVHLLYYLLGGMFWLWSWLVYLLVSVASGCTDFLSVYVLLFSLQRFNSVSIHWFKRLVFLFCIEGVMYLVFAVMVFRRSKFSFVLYRIFHHSELPPIIQYRYSHGIISNFADDVYPNSWQYFDYIVDLNLLKET